MSTTQQPEALHLARELELGTFAPNVLQNETALRMNAAAELRRQHAALSEWFEKTEWVQKTIQLHELGKQLADVLRERIEKLQADNETLRTGYAAARLEIESLQRRVQEVGAAARREHERADRAMRAAQPATADDRVAFKAYLEDCDECAIVPDIAGAFHSGWKSRVRAAQPAVAQQPGTAYVALPDANDLDGALTAAEICINSVIHRAQAGNTEGAVEVAQHVKQAIAQAVAFTTRASHGQAPAQAAPAAVAGPSAITASIMRDDGGEQPAFCLMVAYRSEKDARAALAMIAASQPLSASEAKDAPKGCVVEPLYLHPSPPEGMVTGGSLDHLKLMMEHSAFAGALQLDDALANIDEFACASLSANAVAQTPAHIKAMERAWLWMENQADSQSKGGHATFDLMMLREERDALRAALDAASTTQPVPQQEAQEPVAWYVTGCGRLLDEYEAEAEARRIGGTAKAMPLYTVPQPSPTSQGDALDAARYRWLRDSTEWEPFDSAWLNKHDIYGCPTPAMDAAIDAARAAQEGK